MVGIVNSYTINGTNTIVRPGDCVLIRPEEPIRFPYVARVNQLRVDGQKRVMVMVRWYYRPRDTNQGMMCFNGFNELYLSDHYDWQDVLTIYGKCTVHTMEDYINLDRVTGQDFFSRFEYKVADQTVFCDSLVRVYCRCEMPYNPDRLMVQCEDCDEWFHPSCDGITIEDAETMEQFVCSKCRRI